MWRFTSDLCENHETQGSVELGVGFVGKNWRPALVATFAA
jgi:hypothetical protein